MIDEYVVNCDHEGHEDRFNIALFQAVDAQGHDVSDKVRYVQIWFSKNSMLGLGTELIRLAHNFEEGKEVTIKPSTQETGPQQEMGMYLTPDSCPLTIRCQSFEPIEKLLEEYERKNK